MTEPPSSDARTSPPGHLTADTEATQILGLEHTYRLASDPGSPLVYFVHGRAGTYDVMWLFRRAVPESFHIIAPQAPLVDPLRGFSWWQVADDREVSDAEVQKSGELLSAFCHRAPSFYDLSPSKTIAIGFSQGGGILSWAIQKESLHFDGLGFLASFLFHLPPHEQPSRLPVQNIFWAHGSRDDVVPCLRAREDVERLKEMGAQVQYSEEEVGHKVGSQSLKALKSWIESFTA